MKGGSLVAEIGNGIAKPVQAGGEIVTTGEIRGQFPISRCEPGNGSGKL